MSISHKQIQTISTKEKLADTEKGEAWRKANVDYYANRNSEYNKFEKDFEDLYKIAGGHLNSEDYNYITSPYSDKNYGDYQVILRNYDIVTPLIQLLLGEKSKRVFRPIVIALNTDHENIKQEELRSLMNLQLDQLFINNVNSLLGEEIVPSRNILGLEDINRIIDNIPDEKANQGQDALDYIVKNNDLKRIFRKGFYDYLVTAFVFTIKDIKFDEVTYETVSPVNCGYIASDDVDFVEDGECAWTRRWMTSSDIISEFWDVLTEDEIKDLEEGTNTGNSEHTFYLEETNQLLNSLAKEGKLKLGKNDLIHKNNLHEVLYVNWKSKVKMGRVKILNLDGTEEIVEVDENYIPSKGEEIEWFWVDQTWEGTRIKDKYYKKIRPIPYQRGTFNNPSACKLLINGRTVSGRHYYTKSVVEKLKPYSEIYNAVHWHLEKVMNKNKDKLVVLPKDVIPNDEDIDMYGMMYHADADGFLFLDEVDPKKSAALNAIKVLDLSLRDYLGYLQNLLLFIKQQAEDSIGINRQRKGQSQASDGKGVTEQAIFQSAIISEELFLGYEEFEERELQGLMDLSKFAWSKGKKSYYLTDEKRKALLNIEGEDYRESEFKVFASNGREEGDAIARIRANTQAMYQNGARPSIVAKLETSNNITEMMDLLEIEEERMLQQDQQQAQQQQQIEQEKLDFERQKHEDNLRVDLYKIDSQIMAAQINAASFDNNPDNDVKRLDIINKQEELKIKREEIAAKILMNRENNQTALKNKVAGEK